MVILNPWLVGLFILLVVVCFGNVRGAGCPIVSGIFIIRGCLSFEGVLINPSEILPLCLLREVITAIEILVNSRGKRPVFSEIFRKARRTVTWGIAWGIREQGIIEYLVCV